MPGVFGRHPGTGNIQFVTYNSPTGLALATPDNATNINIGAAATKLLHAQATANANQLSLGRNWGMIQSNGQPIDTNSYTLTLGNGTNPGMLILDSGANVIDSDGHRQAGIRRLAGNHRGRRQQRFLDFGNHRWQAGLTVAGTQTLTSAAPTPTAAPPSLTAR